MKLGILNAINPASSEVNWNDTPFDGYRRFFRSVNAPYEYQEYRVAMGEFPPSPTACDAYVITGSPNAAYDNEEWIAALIQFIRDSYEAGVKLVGICFGHQILALALGGRVEKSEKGWGFGLKQFSVTVNKGWMDEKPATQALYFAHQDQVVELPPQAELLGGSDFCPIGLYVIEGKALGIQGHPEFTPGIMDDIAAYVEDEMEADAYQTAVESIHNGRPDNQQAGRWILNFLEQ